LLLYKLELVKDNKIPDHKLCREFFSLDIF